MTNSSIAPKLLSHASTPFFPPHPCTAAFFFRTLPPGQTPYSAPPFPPRSCHAMPCLALRCPSGFARPALPRTRSRQPIAGLELAMLLKRCFLFAQRVPLYVSTLRRRRGRERQHSGTVPVSSDYHFDIPVCCLYLRGPPWPPSLACFLSRFSPSFLYLFFFYSSILLLFCLCPFLLSLSFSPRIDIQINTSHRQNASSIRKRFRQEGCYSLQDQMCTMPHHRKGWSKQGWSKPSRCHEQTLWSS